MNSPDLRLRRRSSARVALYVAFVVAFGGTLAAWGWITHSAPAFEVFDWRTVDYAANHSVQLLQRYIEVDTGPEGDPSAGIELVADLLREGGIEPEIERVGEKDANLWAVIEGDNPRALVLHHHVDVDPIEHPELWTHPPFEGTIHGPWMYGRGAFDMKSVAVAQIEAFLRLAREAQAGRRPARSVILLATSGEETGSDFGTRWLLREDPELVERFGVVLTEGGAVEGIEQGEVKYWGTEVAQKRILEVTVCSDSEQRLSDLGNELLTLGRRPTGLRLSPELLGFLQHYAPTRGHTRFRELLADPKRLARDPAAFEGLPSYVQALFRDELLPLRPRPTEGGWEMQISVQLTPGADPNAVLAERLPPWLLHGVGVTVFDDGAADHGSPIDHPVMAVIEEVLHEHYPDAPVGPMYLAWTRTDARFLRARGIPTYGFSPFMVLTPEVMSLVKIGTVNERIGLPGFVEGVEVYADLVERLAGAPAGEGRTGSID